MSRYHIVPHANRTYSVYALHYTSNTCFSIRLEEDMPGVSSLPCNDNTMTIGRTQHQGRTYVSRNTSTNIKFFIVTILQRSDCQHIQHHSTTAKLAIQTLQYSQKTSQHCRVAKWSHYVKIMKMDASRQLAHSAEPEFCHKTE